MWWHERTWPEISELDKQMPVVIPLGSCEQHGPHLPLFVDSIQVTAVAERVEAALTDEVLMLPTLWLGSSHHHLDFPGTVSVKPALYAQIVRSIAETILAAGFRRLFFLNGHGGNQVPGAQALSELVVDDDRADDAYLVFASWWHVAEPRLRDAAMGMTTPFVSHACEFETSLILALRPELAHLDRIREAEPVLKSDWSTLEHGGRVKVFRRFARATAAGSMGRPSAATPEKGEALLAAVVEETVKFVRELRNWPELPKIGPSAG